MDRNIFTTSITNDHSITPSLKYESLPNIDLINSVKEAFARLNGDAWMEIEDPELAPESWCCITLRNSNRSIVFDTDKIDWSLEGLYLGEAELSQRDSIVCSKLPYWHSIGIGSMKNKDPDSIINYEGLFFLRPRLDELDVRTLPGVSIDSMVNEGTISECVRVGTLIIQVDPQYPASLFDSSDSNFLLDEQGVDLSRMATINIMREVDDLSTIKDEGRNPQLAEHSFLREVKKGIRQLYLIGFTSLCCFPSDQRRRRIYTKLGFESVDPMNPNSYLFAKLDDERFQTSLGNKERPV